MLIFLSNRICLNDDRILIYGHYLQVGVMKYIPEFGLATKVEVLVPDQESKDIIDDIVKITGIGSTSGKIFVYDVVEAYDIGTKTTGDTAL